VPLADLSDARLIAGAIADAMRLPRSPNVEPLEQIVESLSAGPSLLVLDNFEQLIGVESRKSKVESEDGAEVVRTLLERVPSLMLLVTSRRLLGLSGEREFPVLPLPTPTSPNPLLRKEGATMPSPPYEGGAQGGWTPEHLTMYDSVRLFIDRAQASRPDFQVTNRNAPAVAELCDRLEGIPLALELAAARAQVLTPAQMLAQLAHRFDFLVGRKRDTTERHRSLRAAMEWSYRLLSPDLRRFFTRLSLFRGGWTLEAAEAVCEEPLALDYLEHLKECSLVLTEKVEGAMRFRMLETLREFAAEQMSQEDRFACARRHADFFLALTQAARSKWTGPGQGEWLDRMEREHDNLRAALMWFLNEPEGAEAGLEMTNSLWPFWDIRGYWREGRTWLIEALAKAPEPTTTRGKALKGAGVLFERLGDHAKAQPLFEEGLVMHRGLEDRIGTIDLLNALGAAAIMQSNLPAARSRLEEALALAREEGSRYWIGNILNNLGVVCFRQGDYAAAGVFSEESIVLSRERGDRHSAAEALSNLAGVRYFQGDHAAARALLEEELAINRELGDKMGIAGTLNNMGKLATGQGDYAAARSLYEEALSINREIGNRHGEAVALHRLGLTAIARLQYAEARALLAESLALAREIDARPCVIGCLEGLAALARKEGEAERAARLFAAAEALREVIGSPLPPNDRPERDAHLAALREALGESAWSAAWEAGRALTWEQAAACALGEESLPRGDGFP
jgi:predicted ATPase/Flp pilus assembly protein TadD